MDTTSALMMSAAYWGKSRMVFDWDWAADLIARRRPLIASAGLANDWEWTGGLIYRDGRPVPREKTYTFLSSTWAMPQLCMDGEYISCWAWEHDTPGWSSDTYWPPSALARLPG